MSFSFDGGGTIRLDVDASVRGLNQAACGGDIRDELGCWIIGFKKALDTYLTLIRDSGVSHPFRREIEEARQLIYGNWHVELAYARREIISCADQLARDAHVGTDQLILLHDVPPDCFMSAHVTPTHAHIVFYDVSATILHQWTFLKPHYHSSI
ncbi:hypothetical protein K1719_044509 [Acacia pycnantha]|nr:hypothetical protein K1719_044509 [Acacia pycnantha]